MNNEMITIEKNNSRYEAFKMLSFIGKKITEHDG